MYFHIECYLAHEKADHNSHSDSYLSADRIQQLLVGMMLRKEVLEECIAEQQFQTAPDLVLAVEN